MATRIFSNALTSAVAPELRSRINANLQEAERKYRMQPLYGMAVVISSGIVIGALFVDYMIINEFWTRALADEFLELPGNLANSVGFKSLQVLFAAVAAHLFYRTLSPIGQWIFNRVVFVLAFLMLAGLGILLASMSLPAGTQDVFGSGGGQALSGALSNLGLSEAAPEAAASSSLTDEPTLRYAHSLAWLTSLSVIFLVVTGVAALCLHLVESNFDHLVKARDYLRRRKDVDTLHTLEEELGESEILISELDDPTKVRAAVWTGLMTECQAHEKGLNKTHRGRRARKRKLRNETAIKRYETLFDAWWRSRSREAMAHQQPTMLEDASERRTSINNIIPLLGNRRSA